MVAFKGKAHLGITLIVLYYMEPNLADINYWWLIGGAVVGSYLPDCDIIYSPAAIIPAWIFCKHRTYTHSLLALLFVSGICYLFNKYLGYGMFLGYGLHLVGDKMTPMGLPYLLWYPGKKIK